MSQLLNNRYQIEQTLGAGGFGETFLAIDTQMPSQRRCVLKQLRPMTDNPQIYQIVQERFRREAAILETLGKGNHQIPELFAYFTENGLFYLVQEWIEGQTLTDKIVKEGAKHEEFARQILLNALPVLDYVHSKGIIHRDIKPDNIILRTGDAMPVLIDFGAVKETVGTVLNSQGNVTSSIVIGTPGFMASEQAAGRPIFSSDLYSLGLSVIFALTGKVPQELDTDLRTGEILWQRDIPDLTPDFAAVLDRAIQVYPRDRYGTAQEMLTALQSITNANPASAMNSTIVLGKSSMPKAIAQNTSPQKTPTLPNRLATNHSDEPTAVVSPRLTSIPSASNGDRKTILISSLLVGGLVSASIFAGFYFIQPLKQSSNTPEQQAIETNSPTPSVTPTETPIETPIEVPTKNPDPGSKSKSKPTKDILRVAFGAGETGSKLEGSLKANRSRRYLLGAEKGQQFTLQITDGDVSVRIIDPNQEKIGEAKSNGSDWQGALPETGDYTIEVEASASTDYELVVDITGYPWLSARPVADVDLKNKTAFQLDVMRNEIYARYGRMFDDQRLRNYFEQQNWYEPTIKPADFSEDQLSPLEKQNAAYIWNYQKSNKLE